MTVVNYMFNANPAMLFWGEQAVHSYRTAKVYGWLLCFCLLHVCSLSTLVFNTVQIYGCYMGIEVPKSSSKIQLQFSEPETSSVCGYGIINNI